MNFDKLKHILPLLAVSTIHSPRVFSAPAASIKIFASPTGSGTECSSANPCSIYTALETSRITTQPNTTAIEIILKNGNYILNKTLTINEKDTGEKGRKLTIRSENELGATISGETPIKDWTLINKENGIYTANAPSTNARQLYQNDRRLKRASYPKEQGSYVRASAMSSTTPTIILSPEIGETLLRSKNLEETELIWKANWLEKRVRIGSIKKEREGYTITPRSPEALNPNDLNRAAQPNTAYRLENNPEFIQNEGDWAYSRDHLYLKPARKNSLGADLENITIASITNLITIKGSEKEKIRDIEIIGIRFTQSAWTTPSKEGYITLQSALYLQTSKSRIPGAIEIENAENIKIKKCEIKSTGGHAIAIFGENKNITIQENHIHDTSGGGIYEFTGTPKSGYISLNTRIEGNTIHDIGLDYRDSVAILLTRPRSAKIRNNTITNTPYTGISLGWSWDSSDYGTGDNLISQNNISNAMRELSDGGAIYSLGSMPNSRICNNSIEKITRNPTSGPYPISGIYLDNGSNGYVVHSNTITISESAITAKNKPNFNNTIKNNLYLTTLGEISEKNTSTGNEQINSKKTKNTPALNECD